MKDTAFRSWLRQLWMENCRERDEFNDLPYTQSEYFQRYKHWLRREFRFQNQQLSKPSN
jgi:uncharacterized radical SAM superfamily Fe-S cluster-containing enzyme